MAEGYEEKILEVLRASGSEGATISVIYDSLGIRPRAKGDEGKREQVQRALQELVRQGKVKVKSKRYFLVDGTTTVSVPAVQGLEDLVRKAVLDALTEFFGPRKTERDFDRVYDEVKDEFGLARLDAIRKQLGMTEEQFYGRFREHIMRNYELLSGGTEGLILRGVLYGIIKRKVKG